MLLSSVPMPRSGTFKTEAVVLRSIRFGEADRVLHLYTEDRGRVGAVAKGVRRTKSRFGGRLEPLSRVKLVMHEGSGDLCTITAADTVHAHASPLANAPDAPEPALRQADRAIAETAEHHGHVRLRRLM